MLPLAEEIPFNCAVVEGSHLSSETLRGHFTKLSLKQAEARLETPVADFTNLKMHVIGKKGHELPGALYAKVLETTSGDKPTVSIRFTSMGPEIEAYFRGLLPAHDEVAQPVYRTLAGTPEQPRAEVEGSLASAADAPAKKPVAPAPDIAAALSAAASKGPNASVAGDRVPPERKRRLAASAQSPLSMDVHRLRSNIAVSRSPRLIPFPLSCSRSAAAGILSRFVLPPASRR